MSVRTWGQGSIPHHRADGDISAEQARLVKTCQSFVLGGTSCGIRPSVPTSVRVEPGLVNRAGLGSLSTGSPTGRLCILFRVGSMYSQAHISLFNIYWRVWLLVIRGPEKGNLGSSETFMQCSLNCYLTWVISPIGCSPPGQLRWRGAESYVFNLGWKLQVGLSCERPPWAQVLAFNFKNVLNVLMISSCNVEGGNGPSLGCAVIKD